VRIVLDTAILVAAVRSPNGASRQLLLSALGRKYTVLASVALILEYEAVLTREEHLLASGLTAQEMNALIDSVVSVAEPVRLSFLVRPMLRDPDDDLVLEVAVNGRAATIVTLNRRDFIPEAERFGIAILFPGEAFERVKKL
jgi:putative PIN family toxin of toxin-antitoxin system